MASGSPAAAPLLPGQAPPLFTITSTDQAGTIVVVTGVCLAVAVVSVLIRIYILVQLGGTRINWDDGAIFVALLFAIIQSSLVQEEAYTGLGRTIRNVTSHEARKIQQTQFADQIFYILSVWMSKFSVALFLFRLSPRKSYRSMCYGAMVIAGVTGITAVLIVSFVCELSQPWQYFTLKGVTCIAPYNRWIATSVMDIISEVALACVAIRIIWPLQMRSSKKIAVAFAFLQRLAIVAPIIAHLHFLSIAYHTDDPTLHAAYSTICKETEVTFAIVAASVPCLKPFLTATATHYGAPAEGAISNSGQYAGTAVSSKSRSYKSAGSFRLGKLKLGKEKESSLQPASSDENRTQSEHLGSANRGQFVVTSGSTKPRDAASIESDDSKGLIIRKDINYDVQYYDRETSGQKVWDSN